MYSYVVLIIRTNLLFFLYHFSSMTDPSSYIALEIPLSLSLTVSSISHINLSQCIFVHCFHYYYFLGQKASFAKITKSCQTVSVVYCFWPCAVVKAVCVLLFSFSFCIVKRQSSYLIVYLVHIIVIIVPVLCSFTFRLWTVKKDI